MAILVTAEAPGMTAEMDDRVVQQLNLDGNPAPGAIGRLAGAVDGGWRILSVWESREDFDAFVRDRLQPALQQAGRQLPNFQFWDLHSVRFPKR